MSHQAVEWALDILKLRGPTKLVLVALAERADAKGGSCYPGITELARRASTSRRRVIEAISELETLGAIQVHRSTSHDGKRRNVNHYKLAVGQVITVPKKGTTLVLPRNQGGSHSGTGSSTEPTFNPHSAKAASGMPFATKKQDAQEGKVTPCAPPIEVRKGAPQRFPDRSMRKAAETAGIDPEQVVDVIATYRGDLDEAALDANPEAKKQYRTLWFAILNGHAPDLEDKL